MPARMRTPLRSKYVNRCVISPLAANSPTRGSAVTRAGPARAFGRRRLRHGRRQTSTEAFPPLPRTSRPAHIRAVFVLWDLHIPEDGEDTEQPCDDNEPEHFDAVKAEFGHLAISWRNGSAKMLPPQSAKAARRPAVRSPMVRTIPDPKSAARRALAGTPRPPFALTRGRRRYRVWTCRAGEPGFQIDPETEEVTWTYAGLGGRSSALAA
jgi:hypothetical protein